MADFTGSLASALEDVLLLYFIQRRPFARAIEQIHQKQAPLDLIPAVRPE